MEVVVVGGTVVLGAVDVVVVDVADADVVVVVVVEVAAATEVEVVDNAIDVVDVTTWVVVEVSFGPGLFPPVSTSSVSADVGTGAVREGSPSPLTSSESHADPDCCSSQSTNAWESPSGRLTLPPRLRVPETPD